MILKRNKNPKVNLTKEDSICYDKVNHKYIFKCNVAGCVAMLGLKPSQFNKTTGMCFKHSRTDCRPYIALYKNLLRGANNRKVKTIVTLNYEEFVALMQSACFYCGDVIERPLYGYNARVSRQAYMIDRLDNNVGYTKDNSVACCTMCNRMKYSYSKDTFLKQVDKIHKNMEKIEVVPML